MMKTLRRMAMFVLILESAFVIHEYGHLREFQKRGVPIQEFSLGIGPLLYEYQTASSYAISVRLLPIMAYVMPTEEGHKEFDKRGSFQDKMIVYFAGIRNNLAIGLAIVFFLQLLGWRRGNISTRHLLKVMFLTPFKAVLRFVALIVECATWGRINFAEKFLLSTGDINPPRDIRFFILLNLALGLSNLAPIPHLDGGHMFEAVLTSTGMNVCMPRIPDFVNTIVLMAFFVAVNRQDMRFLEGEVGG